MSMYPQKIGPYPPAGTRPDLGELLENLPVSNQHQLLQALIRIQQQLGWIPPEHCIELSQQCGVHPSEIDGIIDFYHLLEAAPTAPWVIHVSTNITDFMLGQQANLERLNAFAASHPERLKVIETSCTGLCEQGPAILVNGWAMGQITPARLTDILARIEQNEELQQWPTEWFAVRDSILRRGPLLSHQITPGRSLAAVKAMGGDAFMQQLHASYLKGRGGAGFYTAHKWQACRDTPAQQKVIACNADEGEPGTFKDRVLLTQHLENVLEGMSIAGYVVGANQGYLYLRKEYLFLHQPITQAIAQRRAKGLLGNGFDIHLVMGAGAYICGEESAMLDSMEGKRGTPRIRPPFPVERGYLGLPTVVNNVETFCNITLLAEHGVEAFTALGPDGAHGSKLHCISGDCARPGVYEFPLGTNMHTILAACGGESASMVQVGGAAGQLIDHSQFELAVDYLNLHSAGSLMVFGPQRCATDLLTNFSQFFANESCGFCTPCRVGTQLMAQFSQQLAAGSLPERNRQMMRETCQVMMSASHCGLGKTAGQSLQQLIEACPIRSDHASEESSHE